MSDLVAASLAYSVASALLMWTAYKFTESDNVLIQMMSQLFHGFSMLVILDLFWVAREAFINDTNALPVATGFLILATVVIAGYSLVQMFRVFIELVKAFYSWATDSIKGGVRGSQRDVEGMDEGRIQGGLGR